MPGKRRGLGKQSSKIDKQSKKTLAAPARVSNLPFGDGLRVGALIEFRTNHALSLGVIEGSNRGKWIVRDQIGTEFSVRNQDVTLLLPGKEYTRRDVRDFLEDASSMDSNLVQIAWSTAKELPEPIKLEDMARIMLGGTSPQSLYSAYAALKEQTKYFRQAGKDPPSYHRINSSIDGHNDGLEKARQAHAARQKSMKSFADAVSEALKDPNKRGISRWEGGPHEERIRALKDLALGPGPWIDVRNLAVESLRALNMSLTPNGAVTLLEELGIVDRHAPLALIRAGMAQGFDAKLEAEAESIMASAVAGASHPEDIHRKDLTHLRAISIDNKGTEEIDDALSIEHLEDGKVKIWVHVADVSRWIEFGSKLDLEGMQRAIAMYLPTETIPCFPWMLARGTLSLNEGKECMALSTGVILKDNGEIESKEIILSRIKPTNNLSYSDVDEILEKGGDTDVNVLHEMVKKRAKWRTKQGAISIDLPECVVRVDVKNGEEEPEVLLKKKQDTPAKAMVEEMMILANEVAGIIGKEAGLALPYRTQPPPMPLDKGLLSKIPEGLCVAAALRRRMTSVVVQCHAPGCHASLGVQAYVQATSPIRRVVDLLAHRQLKSHIIGMAPPVNVSLLESFLSKMAQYSHLRSKVQTNSENYWIAEYFRQNMSTKTWKGLVLIWKKKPQRIASVLLLDFGLEVPVRIVRDINVGDTLELCVEKVDVKSGMFRLGEK
ncbi:hypothetical protein BSKO_10994 [Bryopsis sp. KO-2023]|nr:hypothetical protein BSKO_10994 [Bryopsis sp. KO-2023]